MIGPAPQPTPAPDKPTVLFVDDEERILRSLAMMFRSHYRVLTTTDGREAIEMVARERIHVVVSDQRMPLMLGVDLLRVIRERSPNTMRLLLTGYSDLQAVVDSINEGEIFRYVSKPWDPGKLKELIAKAAEISIALNEAPDLPPEMVNSRPGGILVLDNQPETYQMVQELCLTELADGREAVWAKDLKSVLSILSERPISVLITDLNIEGVDVTGLIKSLKCHYPELLCIVLTSFKDTNTLVELVNQGQVHRYLPRPGNKRVLARSIRSALGLYQKYMERPTLVRQAKVEEAATDQERKFSNVVSAVVRRIKGLAGGAAGK